MYQDKVFQELRKSDLKNYLFYKGKLKIENVEKSVGKSENMQISKKMLKN